jgi:hypothetical protein
MRVALLNTFMERIRHAVLDAALGEPAVRFNFGDVRTDGFASSVDRPLKRYPELERFVTMPVARMVSA